jgi:hypothetical protein
MYNKYSRLTEIHRQHQRSNPISERGDPPIQTCNSVSKV